MFFQLEKNNNIFSKKEYKKVLFDMATSLISINSCQDLDISELQGFLNLHG